MRIRGQPEIAKAFGVTVKTIAEWQAAGFPVAVHGKAHTPNEYDLPDCIDWLVKREVGKVQGESQRDRVFRLQGDEIAMRLAEKQKLLIPAAEVEPMWAAACVAAREQLQRSRRALARKLAKATDVKTRERLIGEVHDEFLRTMAEWESAGAADEAAAP